MVLRYIVSDTDLVKYGVAQLRRGAVQQTKEAVQPNKNISSRKKRVRFWLLFVVNVVLWVGVYIYWTTDKESAVWKFLTTNRGMVAGIVYFNQENPSAIICDKIVHEGDMVDGYKVIKIHRDRVELEKNGESLTKRLRR